MPDIFFHFLTTFSKRRKTTPLLFISDTKLEFKIPVHALQVMMVKKAIFSVFTGTPFLVVSTRLVPIIFMHILIKWKLEEKLSNTDFIILSAVNGYSDGSMKNVTVPMGEDVYFHFLNVGNDLLTIHVYGLNTSTSPQSRVGLSTVTLYPWDSKSIVTRFDTPGSFQYEELTSQGHTTRIHGFYIVLSNTKTTE